ncbi:class A beta-lactamase [Neorhizobium sp. DT-125]|uniref:class A beta-lactamase n=1 Tax=Neorhizobium sp. DT-125 TaxID=3396163 RepID=UPI003F1C7A03
MQKETCLAAALAILVAFLPTQLLGGGFADLDRLRLQFQALANAHPARVGICAQGRVLPPICVNGEQRFSLRSAVKIVIAAAVMQAVDEQRMALDDRITIRREDLSVNIQPIADIVVEKGAFETTIGDLVRRAVVDNDNAAADVLIARLGGTSAIQAFLHKAGLQDIRIDRTERELQTEIDGLVWTPEFVFPERLEEARNHVSEAERNAAFEAYLRDPRDTATPRAMVAFLQRLATGTLVSAASTAYLLGVMEDTVNIPDGLRPGIPSDWTIGHRTGTSPTREGVNGVTNDVGILTTPWGNRIAVAVFVAESRADESERAALIAAAARAITSAYQ